MKPCFLAVLCFVCTSAFSQVQTKVLVPKDPSGFNVTVKVKGLKPADTHSVKVEIMDPKKKIYQQIQTKVTATEMEFTFEKIPKGKYAVRFFQDENNNGKLDTNTFGMPTEGWGNSNDARGFMSAPKIEDMLFELNRNMKIEVTTEY